MNDFHIFLRLLRTRLLEDQALVCGWRRGKMRCARAPVYGGGEGAVAEILAARYVGAVILHLPAITVWMVQKQQFMGYKQQQLLVRTLNSSATNNLLR